MIKFLGKAGLLTAIVCVLLLLLSPFLTPKWIEGYADNGSTYMTTTTQGFLSAPEDSADVLFVGSSQVLRDVSNELLQSEYGIYAWSRSTTVQPPAVSYYYLEDALKRQDVKLVVAEFSSLYLDYDPDYREPYVRYAFDWMPLSAEKLEAVSNTLENSETQNLLDFAFPALYYHNRWSELGLIDLTWPVFGDKTDSQRGAILLDKAAPQDFKPLQGNSSDPEPYSEASLYWYQKMIDLCKEKGIEIVMLRLPRLGWTEEKHAADLALAEKNGIALLDANLQSVYDEIGLDAQTDFYDHAHLDTAGAVKLTRWLGELLTEKQYNRTNP